MYEIFESLNKPIIVADKDLNIIYSNDKGYMFFDTDVCKLKLNELFENHLPLLNACRGVIEKQSSVLLSEYNFVCAHTGNREIDLYLSIHNDDLIISINELTEIKRGTTTNKNLFAMLAHEIKNPLSSISGASQLLHKKDKSELTELIINETDRIAKLVSELENITELTNVKFSSVNIHEVLDKVSLLSDLAENDIKIKKQYDPSLPNVWGEDDKLIQIFLNLVKNAAQEKSINEITIKTNYLSGVKIIIDDVEHKAMSIDIIDNGDGIPVDDRSKIFTPHQSTKSGGKGLGLAIVSMLAFAHYGKATFTTSSNGTTFSIILPLEAQND